LLAVAVAGALLVAVEEQAVIATLFQERLREEVPPLKL
jgi:hypothetical protein